jgi:hypothetical protein
MLKKTILISGVVALLTVTASARGHHGEDGYGFSNGFGKNEYQRVTQTAQQTSQQLMELTKEQQDSILFMIEEEKLARDVYSYLYELWGDKIFKNISRSEQKHIDAIDGLLEKYGLESPATLDNRGEFQNQELQELYNNLIEKGKNSLIDALEVGVTIEEKDIADLEEKLDSNLPKDFAKRYQNLLNASYNHLKAFNRQLGR